MRDPYFEPGDRVFATVLKTPKPGHIQKVPVIGTYALSSDGRGLIESDDGTVRCMSTVIGPRLLLPDEDPRN